MRTHNIPQCFRKIKEILIMPPDLALLSTLIGSNYPCLELIFMVPKLFHPLKFDCNLHHCDIQGQVLQLPQVTTPAAVKIKSSQ